MSSETHAVDSITKAGSRVQMTQVAVAMLSGSTTVEIAKELSIPKTRVERWRRDPVFKDVLAEVEAQLSAEVVTDAATYMQAQIDRLLPAAFAAIEEGLNAEKMSDRLNAAGKVLSLKKPARETTGTVIPIEAMIRERAVSDVSPATGD